MEIPNTPISRVRRHWPILLPIALALGVFHAWVIPGDIIGADWVRRVPEELNSFFPWTHVWNAAQQMGETNQVYLFSFPLFSIEGALSRIGVPWSTIERLLYLWPYLILSIAAPYALAYRIARSPIAGAVAASVFCVNSWIVMATERGAIPSIVAASIIPLFILATLHFIDRATPRRALGLGLLLTAVLVYDLRYVYISVFFAVVLMFEQLLRDRSLRRLVASLPSVGVAIGTIAVTNLFWIWPQFFEPANAGAGYGSVADYIANSAFMSPAHSLADFAVFYHWVASNNPFRADPPDWFFFILPAALFASFAACWKRKWIWSFAVGAFVALLLDSGPTWPVDGINLWIFTHLPGMSLFRDVTKWMSLLELTFGIVLGLGAARLSAWIGLVFKRDARTVRALAVAVPVLCIAAYALVMNDAFNVTRFRVFSTYHVASDTLELERFIATRPRGERVLVIPRDSEPMRAVIDHPFAEAMQLENSASPDGLRHFNMSWNDLFGMYSAPYAAALLRTLNVGYVVVPYDYDKIIYSPYIARQGYYDVLDFIRKQPWAGEERVIGKQVIFSIKGSENHQAFTAPYPFILNGSGPALAALAGTPLVNGRMAAVLPDQPLRNLPEHLPNYAAGGWAIDANLNSPANIARWTAQTRALARDDAAGRFSYSVRAASTATSADNIVWLDDPTLLNSTFRTNRTDATYVATMQDAGKFYAPVAQAFGKLGKPKRVELSPETTESEIKDQFSSAGVENGVIVRNSSPFVLRANLTLRDFTLRGARTIHVSSPDGSKTWTCSTSVCTLDGAILNPGTNRFAVRADGVRRKLAPHLNDAVDVGDPVPVRAAAFNLYRLSGPLSVRVDEEPFVSYDGPPSTSLRFIAYEMISRRDGSRRFYLDRIGGVNYHVTIEDLFTTSLTQHFLRVLEAHAGDRQWLFEHRLSAEPDGTGEWTIGRVFLATLPHAKQPRPTDSYRLFVNKTPRDPVVAVGSVPAHALHFRIPLEPELSAGTRLLQERRLPGLLEMTLTSPKSAKLEFKTSGPHREWLSFDVYVDRATSVRLRLQSGDGTPRFAESMVSEMPDQGYAAGRMTSLCRATEPWTLDLPHAITPMGAHSGNSSPSTGCWKHFELSISGFGQTSDSYRLLFTVSSVGGHRPVRFAFANDESQGMLAANVPPALLLDGALLPPGMRDTLPDSGLIRIRGNAHLKAGPHHTIVSYPTAPVRPAGLALAFGTPRAFESATLEDVRVYNDSETEGRIGAGGLLVYEQAFDPMWKAALVPDSLPLSGTALFDFAKLKPYFVSDSEHYKVDDILNGWWIPGGHHRVVFFMALDVQLQLGALICSILSIAWIAGTLLLTSRARHA